MKVNGFMRYLLSVLFCATVACSTAPVDDSGFEGQNGGASDEFSEFDSVGDAKANPEAGIESELVEEKPANAPEAPAEDEFSQFENPPAENVPPPEQSLETPAELPPAVANQDEVPPPTAEPEVAGPPTVDLTEAPPAATPPPVETVPPTGRPTLITDIQYRANDNGGTIVIEGAGPLTFNQRLNSETRQFIIEIPNSQLPAKLKRPLNTRDFAGVIGSIDAYQHKKSTTAKVVVQLRPEAPEPVIQTEGNRLLVVTQPPNQNEKAEGDAEGGTLPSPLLASDNIEEFLATNQRFYGKRISIETEDAEVRDVFSLISEESNVNLIIADEVKGKVSLKLKNVPWDQALVMIMKAKKLGYVRVGNVLRIAPLTDLKSEEEDALKMIASRKANAPFKVKNIAINYAKVEELEKQLKGVLSAKGTVIADARTSTIIITDQDENVERAEKLVKSLDIPPQQVLIEGKVVEASDNFDRNIGINWGAAGRPYQLKGIRSTAGPLRSTTSLNISPTLPTASTFGLNFSLGTLDILGDLSASLRLFESQNLVKVISSPRVVTLHNEPAEISQTEEIPLITANVNANGTSTPVVNFKPVKLRLSVTPQITNDGAIVLGVDVAREVAGAVVDQATQARPVNSRAAKTKVIVKNSQTAVIGGIFQNDTTEGEQRVPILADIPIFGWLFKTSGKSKRRNELLIFLTPRILGQLEVAPSSMNSGGGDF